MMSDISRRLLESERPEPGRAMRERVLAATMPLVQPDHSRLDRMWFSPKWRMAAVLGLAVLAGVEAVSDHVAPAPEAQYSPPPDPAQTVAMVAIEMGLTPADAAALVAQVLGRSQNAVSLF
jgi:hypothetical protein